MFSKYAKLNAEVSRNVERKIKNMLHCGTQRLETERLILRRFTKEDAAAMYKNWASDDEVKNI